VCGNCHNIKKTEFMTTRQSTRPALSRLQKPVLNAHRGDKTRYPENTLAAFRAALAAGAEMIELDIALSKDRQIVVIHDDTVERTTNGTGAVAELTLSELKELDAGSWFDPHFAGERIPTLREVLELVNGRAVINIEIKKSAFEEPAPADAVESQLLALIKEMQLGDRVLISSFEFRFLERVRSMNPDLPLGAISTEPAEEKTVADLKKMGCYSWHGWCETMTEDQIRLLHDAGFKVFSFTVNEPGMFGRLKRFGIDGVFSDDCPLLRQML